MVKKSNAKKFAKIAKQLPIVNQKVKTTMLGKDLIEKYPESKQRGGKDIDPNKTYVIDESQPRNHEKQMKKLYTNGKWSAVIKYVKQFEIKAR